MHSSYDCDIASDLVWMKKSKKKRAGPLLKEQLKISKHLT
jgi:hypothetical protein